MSSGAAPLSRTLPPVYAAAALRFLLPVLILPLVASRVGAQEFGRLGFILVWSALLSVLVEGGFLAAATRLAVRDDAAARWRIAQQVFSARCVLSVPALLLAIPAALWVGQGSMADAAAIAALALALGWPATWYLQATQQLARWARVEFVVYLALLIACWAFAYSVAVYVALQLLATALLAALGWRWLRRDLRQASDGAALWTATQLRPGLRMGWTMLPVSIAGAAYSYALPAAASAQLSKPDLGLYFLADRIVRAVLAAGEPVFAVVYPRIVALFAQGAQVALRHALRWAVAGAAAGAVLWALGWAAWPALAQFAAARDGGIDTARLAPVMAVLGALLPLLLGWKFIGYWMLGSGLHDRAYRACVIAGGVFGVVAVATFGGAAGAVGLAWTAIAAEGVVIATALLGMTLLRARTEG